ASARKGQQVAAHSDDLSLLRGPPNLGRLFFHSDRREPAARRRAYARWGPCAPYPGSNPAGVTTDLLVLATVSVRASVFATPSPRQTGLRARESTPHPQGRRPMAFSARALTMSALALMLWRRRGRAGDRDAGIRDGRSAAARADGLIACPS